MQGMPRDRTPNQRGIFVIRTLFKCAAAALIRIGLNRSPDFIVGGHDRPYLRRWFLIPRNRFLNVYLHQFLRDDDDRALHDHPWAWCSILLRGAYVEHTIAAGGVHCRQLRQAPSIKVSGPWRAHRVELLSGLVSGTAGTDWVLLDDYDETRRMPAWTLFITGPRMRSWGFHCERRWVDWREFTDPDDTGATGRGCDAANDNEPAQATRKGAA